MANPKLSHRTRLNLAAIEGLANAISGHAYKIKDAAQFGTENALQLALADLLLDSKVIEQAIVEGVQSA